MATPDADGVVERGPELQRMTIVEFIEREIASGKPRTVVDEYYGVSWTPQEILNDPLFDANRNLQVLVCDDYLMYRDGDNTEIFSLKTPEAKRTRELLRR